MTPQKETAREPRKPVNEFEKRRERDINRNLENDCPKCGAKAGQNCANLSNRNWQRQWTPATHKERKAVHS